MTYKGPVIRPIIPICQRVCRLVRWRRELCICIVRMWVVVMGRGNRWCILRRQVIMVRLLVQWEGIIRHFQVLVRRIIWCIRGMVRFLILLILSIKNTSLFLNNTTDYKKPFPANPPRPKLPWPPPNRFNPLRLQSPSTMPPLKLLINQRYNQSPKHLNPKPSSLRLRRIRCLCLRLFSCPISSNENE